jgi:N-sulfoglucosamine sulfohydrolase
MNKIFLISGLSVIIGGCNQQKDHQKEKMDYDYPNIILLVSDDHGTDALGCYGNPVINTPNLDFLAREGARFTNAYCTSASCSASRSVILTGMYNHAIGHYGHEHEYHHFRTFDTIMSLPKYLESAGYHTARIGKYHLAPESVYSFQEVLECNPRSTIEMAEKSKKVINGDKPFFLYFCFDDPHRGHPFRPDPWDSPNDFGNIPGGYPGEVVSGFHPDEVIVPPFLPDNPQTRDELVEYYQSVERIDQGIGRLLEILSESGKDNNTVIIYISDNGIAFPGAKTTVYDPGIQLPLIVYYPWMGNAGIVNNAMVSWADLTPTIMDIAGLDASRHYFQGRSFKDIIEEEDPAGWDHIFASHTFHEVTMYYPMRVLRNRQYKLIWNIAYQLPFPFASDLWASSTWQSIHRGNQEVFGMRTVDAFLFRPEFELYDIQADPNEIFSLHEHQEYQHVLEVMKEEIRHFQLRTRDPWFIMWDNDPSLQGTGVNL